MVDPVEPIDPAREGARMSFDGHMAYGDYLSLDRVLEAQNPISDAPDEMLFIIQHQTSELWMKLMLYELDLARNNILKGELPGALKRLARVSRIMEQLNSAWDVLRTMTPSDYTTFRDKLGESSGFQSHQYRMIEFTLGNRNRAMIKPHAHRPGAALLEAELTRPSLYQGALAFARSQGMALSEGLDTVPRDTPWQAVPEIVAMWETIYRNPQQYWSLYELAEKMMDLEDYFRRWRFNHVTTVERVIGFKRGTGGTAGVSYLRRMLEVELFPELWHVRTEL